MKLMSPNSLAGVPSGGDLVCLGSLKPTRRGSDSRHLHQMFTRPIGSCELPLGVNLGLSSQRQGFCTHCHFGSSTRRKQRQNDLSFMPD